VTLSSIILCDPTSRCAYDGIVGYFIYGLFFIRLQGGGRKGYTLSTASSYFVRNLFARSNLRKLQ
jgi:hypothetical protein